LNVALPEDGRNRNLLILHHGGDGEDEHRRLKHLVADSAWGPGSRSRRCVPASCALAAQ
jgi:hypothetical protein